MRYESLLKNYGSPISVRRLKVAPNMADQSVLRKQILALTVFALDDSLHIIVYHLPAPCLAYSPCRPLVKKLFASDHLENKLTVPPGCPGG